jgi:hypothetical protein
MEIQLPNITIIAILIVLFAFGISMIALRRNIKVFKRSSTDFLQEALMSGVLDVPVLAAYTGIKGFGALCFAENNFNPSLVLYHGSMEYKVLSTHSADYSQVELVRCTSFLTFHLIRFIFNDRLRTFSAHVVSKEVLQTVAEFLRNRGVEVFIRD